MDLPLKMLISTEAHCLPGSYDLKEKYLFVNANASEGMILVEVLNSEGQIIDGYSKSQCHPVKSNGTRLSVEWEKKTTVKDLSGKPVQIRFYLKNSALYSFWISKYKTGESDGYTAGGGPDLHPSGIDIPLD
jgi:hypothetical protein